MLSTVHGPAGEPAGTAGPATAWPALRSASPVARWNSVVIALGVAVTAAVGWQERWIADDGLIVLRTARQLLAGNGPVFNVGERVEVNTSTVWTVLVTVAGLVPGVRLDWAAVGLGLVLAAAGMGIGMDAARRLHGEGSVLVPVGAAVLLALPPMRDFVTSGLETGLVTFWLAAAWWLMVGLVRDGGRWLPWAAAVVLGLGPLVRPDLGLFTVAGLAVLMALLRPGWRRAFGLAAVAGALPVAYEIFRAGYYGLLVPSAALAKEASDARWGQGLVYLRDAVATYWLWVPVAAVLVALVMLLVPGAGWGQRRATVAVTLLPLVSGLAMGAYVTRVGGDFMHGRMLLPAITATLLPVFLVPVTRRSAAPLLVAAVWLGFMASGLGLVYGKRSEIAGIVDERAFWSAAVDSAHPVSAEDFVQGNGAVRRSVRAVQRVDGPSLVLLQDRPGADQWRVYPAAEDVDHTTIPFLNLGMMGAAQPLDVRVIDAIGLSNPLARHATPMFHGRIGHDKDLPPAWFFADEGREGASMAAPRQQVLDARTALTCPGIAEVLDSVRAPLTPARFWSNLTGSVERTTFRYSRLPSVAARDCGL